MARKSSKRKSMAAKTTVAAEAPKADVPKKLTEPEKPVETEEQVAPDIDSKSEEIVEDESEYEEVEVEEEVDEEVEEEEEVEVEEEVEEEEEEVEAEEEEVDDDDDTESKKIHDGDVEMRNNVLELSKDHAELLALPPHGSEVYIGGFSSDTTEEDLRGFCGTVGEVTEVRIMDGRNSSKSKGFAFVTFRTKRLASKAIKKLNDTQFKGKKIKCSTSQSKHRLFIGNVPRNWTAEDVRKSVIKVGPGVNDVHVLKDLQKPSRNRGFAFIEYYNHACAEYSRKKLSDPLFKLGNNSLTVSWADPRNSDSSAASQVKSVYVENLPKNITQDQLKKLFERHGKITKVVLPPAKSGMEEKRYGFVHFSEQSSAAKVLKHTEKYKIDGHLLVCSLAKPHAEQKTHAVPSSQKSGLLPRIPTPGHGMVGGVHGVMGAGYAAPGFGQPLGYGMGVHPAGVPMMPMLLPDGRVAYVLQQQGTPPAVWDAAPQGGRRGGGSGRKGSRYNPY